MPRKPKSNKTLIYAGVGLVAFFLLMSVFSNIIVGITSLSVQFLSIIIVSIIGVMIMRPETISKMATLAGIVTLIVLGITLLPYASNSLLFVAFFTINIINIVVWFIEALIIIAILEFARRSISGE